jgi:hypothetical protein
VDAPERATGRLCLLKCYVCTKTFDKEKSILCPLDASFRQKGFGVARSGRIASYFVRSAHIPGETIKTLIVIGHIDCDRTTTVLPKAEDTPHFIQLAVGNSILSCWAQAQGVLAIASANLPRQLALSLSRNPGF